MRAARGNGDPVPVAAATAGGSSSGWLQGSKWCVVIDEPMYPRTLAVIRAVNTDATRWFLGAGGKTFHVNLFIFESDRELYKAAGPDISFANLSDSHVHGAQHAAV